MIHFLEGRVFVTPDDLNAAIAEQVEVINARVPFRGEQRSRRAWFEELERSELLDLPEHRWEPVVWRKAKVHRDWHIQIDTIKYSVPYEFVGLAVDVRILGTQLDILAEGEAIATHQLSGRKNGYITNSEYAPAYLTDTTGLWTRAYFTRQAAKVGPGTVIAIERLLDGRKIEAQGFRSCMNVLDLAKNGNRMLLERACARLITDEHRQITYTAVKHALTAVRAEQDQRPRSSPASDRTPSATTPVRPTGRDTSGAYLAGAEAFTLDALTRKETGGAS